MTAATDATTSLEDKVQTRRDLEAMDGELSRLNQATEGDFLRLGSQLHTSAVQARDASTLCSQAASALAGERIQANARKIDEAVSAVEQLELHTCSQISALSSVGRGLLKVQRSLEEFDRIVRTLRILGMSTRIESARLERDDVGFSTFAQEIAGLADEIARKLEAVVDKVHRAHQLTTAIESRLAETGSRHQQNARKILQNAKDCLSSLVDKQRAAAAATEQLGREYAALSRHISEIVVSIQFQDITRQRIEHIQEALRDLIQQMTDEASTRERSSACLVDVCSLQAVQLEHAGKELIEAVDNVVFRLQEMGTEVVRMAAEANRLFQTGDNGRGQSFLGIVENSLTETLATIERFSSEIGEFSDSARTLFTAVGEVLTLVEEVNPIGTNINRIALNSAVKAAHLGFEGVALGTVAVEIQRLSNETRSHVAGIRSDLTEVEGAAQILSDDRSNAVADSVQKISANLLSVNSGMAQLQSELAESMEKLRPLSETVSSEIRKSVSEITSRDVAIDVFEEVQSGLRHLVEHWSGLEEATDPELRARLLKELEARYTMVQEQKVHDSFAAEQSDSDILFEDFGSSPSPDSGETSTDADDLLGDVDFF